MGSQLLLHRNRHTKDYNQGDRVGVNRFANCDRLPRRPVPSAL